MLDFDERDLVALAERAGFEDVHLHLEIDIGRREPRPWEVFLNSSGNSRIPTLAEVMGQALTPGETERLTSHLRPLVEQGHGQRRMAVAYLWAIR